jgi:hypothetical protein
LEDLGEDVRIIFKRILKRWDGEAWNGFLWHRIGKGGGGGGGLGNAGINLRVS